MANVINEFFRKAKMFLFFGMDRTVGDESSSVCKENM